MIQELYQLLVSVSLHQFLIENYKESDWYKIPLVTGIAPVDGTGVAPVDGTCITAVDGNVPNN